MKWEHHTKRKRSGEKNRPGVTQLRGQNRKESNWKPRREKNAEKSFGKNSGGVD